ncbi:myosuppressin isoform X4 [Helicoverpa armigera]|uniref:Myosuppressin n=1 Tax=Helicoverpa armigera TaxID=29058 RepID=M4QC48_HELAM|nr:myosuppressin isoform X4 [Helicoverpa armigera]XP_047034629.1 myosuppressin isoform X3 [Helicoverpa zea]AGH25562.1 myosuppressin [Helicoverpa armigera]WGD18931.1 myosuppressin [Helicoverpa armigera]
MALGNVHHLAVVCVVLAWCACAARSAPAQLCAGAADDDPRAARFCQALNTFLELYAEAAGEQVPEYQALVRDYPQLLDTGMKRQDVVHSFLRFGRRR